NNLLAAPTFESWRSGEPLDVARMLRAADGRPRLSVVSIAHLSDEERLFVVALLLDKVKTWMRRQGGTGELRALVYMDEVFGYFPPHPANPPTKRPLLTLLKQARAQGVGVVLATQNPVDLDYKGLANMGTWLVGTLQTQQDRERLKTGLQGAGLEGSAVDRLLGATKKRVFLLHDVHRPSPCLLQSRWAMSYLRGPLTREEISRLGFARPAAAGSPAAAPVPSGPPVLPPPFRNLYLAKRGGQLAASHLLVKYAVRYKGADELVGVRAWPLGGSTALDALEAEPFDVDEKAVVPDAPGDVRYLDPPSWLASAGAKGLEKALRQRLDEQLTVKVFRDPVTDATSLPGETRDAFAARIGSSGGGDALDRLRQKLEKRRGELSLREQEVSGRKQEKWMAVGSALLRNIGLLTGRKRSVSVSGVGSILTKNRMEGTAEARVEGLRSEVADLERQLSELSEVDPARLTEETLAPVRGGVDLLRYDLVWVY
ncbi:MAG: ATP-binding protein, partial [Betaproteobacteria bacterium]